MVTLYYTGARVANLHDPENWRRVGAIYRVQRTPDKDGGVWMASRERCESVSRMVAIEAMEAAGLDPDDFRLRDRIINAIHHRINGSLDDAAGRNRRTIRERLAGCSARFWRFVAAIAEGIRKYATPDQGPRAVLLLFALTLATLAGCSAETPQAAVDSEAAVVIAYASLTPTFTPDGPTPEPEPEPSPAPEPQKKPVPPDPEPTPAVPPRGKIHATYKEAYAAHDKYGRPLLVIIGSDSCSHCRRLHAALPGHAAAGVFDACEVSELNTERDRKNVQAVLKAVYGTPPARFSVPVVVVFKRGKKGAAAVGYQTREQLQKMIAP